MMPCLRSMSSRGQNTHLALQMLVLSICTMSGRTGERSLPVASISLRTVFAWRESVRSTSWRACFRMGTTGS